MPARGGVPIARCIRGENRFYSPPQIRKLMQERQLQVERERREMEKEQEMIEEERVPNGQLLTCSMEKKNECGLDDCSISSRIRFDATNLDRFLEYTTPVVPVQFWPETGFRDWGSVEMGHHPHFVLGDLWESFKEWSAYGAGVPHLLNGSDSVVQYYVPYLSGIQLYMDSSIHEPGLRVSEESHGESLKERSINNRSGNGFHTGETNIQSLNMLSMDENKTPGHLIYEYFEHDPPFGREPLADKVLVLASRFPELQTVRSCDLSSSSWLSVAWYPIYRIPTGPTLQNLDACFLTFHSLSSPSQCPGVMKHNFSGIVEVPLPIFGLASYKFKVSVWSPDGVYECQKANSLLREADDWLHRLQVYHPDYRFFMSHNPPKPR